MDEGDTVKLVQAGDDNRYRFEPELVSDRELEQVLAVIQRSEQPLRLEDICCGTASEEVHRLSAELAELCVAVKLEGREGIHFRADLVWHKPLLELRKP